MSTWPPPPNPQDGPGGDPAGPPPWPPPPPPGQYGGWAPYRGQGYSAGAGSGTNPVCVASLVAGMVGILTSAFCFFFSVPIGVVAVVTGIIGLVQIRSPGEGRGMAIAGLCCGGLAIVLPVAFALLSFGFAFY